MTSSEPSMQQLSDSLATASSALELRGVSVAFGGILALNEVTFHMPDRAVTAVIGPNGAGKTTLLNTLCGISEPASGEVRIFGTPAQRLGSRDYALNRIGRSFQHPPLLETETVVENLLVGANNSLRYNALAQVFRPRKVARLERVAIDRAHDVLELLGISELSASAVASLPYGTRKLIDIGRALMMDARILLFDEPTSGLDASEQAIVKRLVMRLRDEFDATVLLVEHHMDVVRAVADHVIGLQAGTVIAQGTASDVLDSEAFRNALVGTADVESDPSTVGPPTVGLPAMVSRLANNQRGTE